MQLFSRDLKRSFIKNLNIFHIVIHILLQSILDITWLIALHFLGSSGPWSHKIKPGINIWKFFVKLLLYIHILYIKCEYPFQNILIYKTPLELHILFSVKSIKTLPSFNLFIHLRTVNNCNTAFCHPHNILVRAKCMRPAEQLR